MLSKEQTHLLNWMLEQDCPLSIHEMKKLGAPYFTCRRIEELYNGGYIGRSENIVWSQGYTEIKYYVTDNGRMTLDVDRQFKRNARTENLKYAFTTLIALGALAVSIIAITNNT